MKGNQKHRTTVQHRILSEIKGLNFGFGSVGVNRTLNTKLNRINSDSKNGKQKQISKNRAKLINSV